MKYTDLKSLPRGISFILLAIFLSLVALPAWANPIEIATIDDLQKIGDHPDFPLDEDYVLTQDIDASATEDWNEGAGFAPIGDSDSAPFTGTFDGRGHVVSNLHIDRPDKDHVGLFGALGSGGSVFDTGVTNVTITGNNRVGALVGNNQGLVNRSYASGAVTGTGTTATGGLVGRLPNPGRVERSHASTTVVGTQHVGGLVGSSGGQIALSFATGDVTGENNRVGGLVGQSVFGSSLIRDSYATGDVQGNAGVGGLVGTKDAGLVENSYSAGTVSGNSSVGGLIGNTVASPTVTNNFWDTTTSEQTNSAGGSGATGLTTAEMKQQDSFVEDVEPPWDFDGIWDSFEGQSYPFLREEPQFPPPGVESPIAIHDVDELQLIGSDPADFPLDGFYYLANNIDASDTVNWNDGAGFNPIGDDSNRFRGTFDGQGHAIGNLHINRPTKEFDVGLFGVIGNGGEVRNLGLEGGQITGNQFVGGLVAFVAPEGTVSNVYATGTVTGSTHVGGLVGQNDGTVTTSYATGAVSGTDDVGGLVGRSFGTVTNAYATGAVSGNNRVGGLVGRSTGTVTASFWDTTTSGQANSSGGTGLATAQMLQQASFDPPWDFDDIWMIDEDASYPYLRDNEQDPPPAPPSFTVGGEVSGLEGTGLVLQNNGADDLSISEDGAFSFPPQLDGSDYNITVLTQPGNPGETCTVANGSGTLDGADVDDVAVTCEVLVIEISSIEELQKIGNDDNYPLNGFYVLTGNIDASATQDWNEGAGFDPIGDDGNRFAGVVDGQGHVISNLHINRPSESDVGLFGVIGSGGEVRNLGLEGGTITGDQFVGGLMGFVTDGMVSSSYATGAVSGNARIGGLAGQVGFGAVVMNSYATGAVSGTDERVGGLAGLNSGEVSNSYTVGAVEGVGDTTGGLIGFNFGGVVNDSFWDTTTSGQETSDGGTGLATAQMLQQASFDPPWNFESIWTIDEGTSYPYLRDNEQDPPPAPPSDEIFSDRFEG